MPLSPSDTRSLLAQLGHFPKRALGQNFLVDGNIVRKSLELGGVADRDTLVEIGPGLGTLTSALLEAGAAVWAVEQDPRLHRYLEESLLPRFPQALHLVLGDAVELPLAALPPDRSNLPFKVIANLPYAIATPWMDRVLGGPLPHRMVLMLQREAADRYSARPGSKSFGAISIFLQSAYDIAQGHAVSPACFHPRPDVDSFLLHLVRKSTPIVFDKTGKDLVRSLFQQRRKQIGSLLRARIPDREAVWLAALARHGLTHQARPEEIPLPVWQNLLQPAA